MGFNNVIFRAVLGIMIPAMYKQICHYYKRLRVKLKLKNLAGIEDLNILKISSANPYYGNNDININVGERCLYIDFQKIVRSGFKTR